MNKTKLLIFALCAIALTGCVEQTHEQYDAKMASRITEFNYKDHRYLKYSYAEGQRCGTVGITHDPDCKCHQQQHPQ